MSTLHERLRDLAHQAPTGAPDPSLWDRAARYHRRRRLGTAAIVAAAVVAVVALLGLEAEQRNPGIEPASPGAVPALPSRIWEPSPWLPGTDGEPTGALALLVHAERKSWTGSERGVVGVSATTGEYRFLDLPDDAGHGHALSPDGTKVAYWLTGETLESPRSGDGDQLPATGVAILDASTGAVSRHEVATDHGLSTDEGLWWSSSATLVFSYGQYRGGDADSLMDQSSSSFPEALLAWDVGEAEPRVTDLPVLSIDATNGRGLLLAGGRVLDVTAGTARRLDYRRPSLRHVSALDPRGTAVAAPRGNRNPNELYVFREDGLREDRAEMVVDDDVWQAVAWIDDDSVALVTRDVELDPIPAAIESVSVSTGERRTLIEAGTFQPSPGTVATDLLAVEPRDYPAPPSAWDPRVVAALLVSVLVVAALGWRGWRRRVRP